MRGKDVIPVAAMRAKIRAAADARHDGGFVLMVRTDALAGHGTDVALERMHSYIAAGADVAFVEALPTKQALRCVAQQLPAPAMANMIPGGATPLCSEQELSDFGYAAALDLVVVDVPSDDVDWSTGDLGDGREKMRPRSCHP